MPVNPVGDMARQFISMRNGSAIKADLSNLAQSLSTGRVTDIVQHLGGDTARYSGINHSLALLDSYAATASETGHSLGQMQTMLGQMQAAGDATSSQLLLISDSSNENQVTEAARAARSTFDTMVNLLNARVAERSLFGGAEVASAPLANAADMIASIQAAIGGATGQAAISAAVDTWFNDPLGGFATMGYEGDTGPAVQKRISENTTLTIDVRADDPALKSTLKSAALAAVTHEMPGLAVGTRSGLLQEAGIGLFGATSGLVAVQARIGFAEESVGREQAEISAQITALEIAKNDHVSADPFDTASRLQAMQLQLETHYAVTARLSRLSLLSHM
ncbi:flagellar hook-associated protein 3 FlgL [Yoonia tamlensis]|uniref:Flagellar hook-associated protein 3 FlgL n=1 Tax=Yoonia tamlensis TaxID=390270 RepID=A0A1I6HC83_9RHOB|nr:flagellin [Yoonia tamlensis]SFR51970.1 flagellar hook-associated protein 3 FlgL [Yoonia tamlensis]